MKKSKIDIIISIIITLIHFIITFFTDHLIFNFKTLNIPHYIFCKVIVLFVLFIFWNFIYSSIKHKINRNYIKNFLIYFIPLFIILLLVWPGVWLGEDNKIFVALALNCDYLYSLNYLTSIFFIVSFMIIPIPTGVTIMQLILFGSIISFIVTKLQKITKNTYLPYLVYVPFLIPHTVFYTLYVNRPLIVGILYLLLITIILFDRIEKHKLTIPKYLIILLLTSLLTTWRKEQAYLVVGIVILLFANYKLKFSIKKLLLITTPLVGCALLVYLPQKLQMNDEIDVFRRNLPTYVTPLTYMLNNELKGENIEEHLNNIDKVIDVDVLKKYMSFYECVPLFFDNTIKDFTYEDSIAFKKSFVYIVTHNLDKFLYSKFETFKLATSIHGDSFSSIDLYQSNDDTLYETNNKYSKTIIDYQDRMEVLKYIEGKTNNDSYNKIWRLIGSLPIHIITVILFLIMSIIKRNLSAFITCGMYLGQATIIFLTAPASYFMYYFYLYLFGWILLTISFVFNQSNQKNNTKLKIFN